MIQTQRQTGSMHLDGDGLELSFGWLVVGLESGRVECEQRTGSCGHLLGEHDDRVVLWVLEEIVGRDGGLVSQRPDGRKQESRETVQGCLVHVVAVRHARFHR